MSQNVPDKKLLRVEMDRRNEPVIVAANIEQVKALPAGAHVVNAAEGLFQLGEAFETASTRGFEP